MVHDSSCFNTQISSPPKNQDEEIQVIKKKSIEFQNKWEKRQQRISTKFSTAKNEVNKLKDELHLKDSEICKYENATVELNKKINDIEKEKANCYEKINKLVGNNIIPTLGF